MTTVTGRTRCETCNKEKVTLKCEGCSKDFCSDHVTSYHQELDKKLDGIELNRNPFQQTLMEETIKVEKHPLIQEIDKWERDSINKIRQTAEEARQMILNHTTEHIKQVEVKLNILTDELRQKREENDFLETDLYQWNEELTRLMEQLDKPSNIKLRYDSSPLITKISIDTLNEMSTPLLNIIADTRWVQNGITVAGGNGKGNELNQLSDPMGIYIDDNQTIYIADCFNHRIVEWKANTKIGNIVAGGNGEGNQLNQLNCPTDVIIDKKTDSFIISDYGNRRVIRVPRHHDNNNEQIIIDNIDCYGLAIDSEGYLYVSDYKKHEVRKWCIEDTTNVLVAGGHGQGNNSNQLDYPTNLFVDHEHSVYVSDQANYRIMKWVKDAEDGIVVASNQDEENSLQSLFYPYRAIVDQMEAVYVTNSDRIMRWIKGTTEGSVIIGDNGHGQQPNQLTFPTNISFDRQSNLYVVDMGNDRVQKFNIILNSTC